jgi:glutathione-specific gamma-glutamylcyclotransferase
MIVGSYIPRWVRVEDGGQGFQAITFAINRQHRRYAGELSQETTVNTIATAHGHLGSCADYLMQTVNGLLQAGIKDKHLLGLRHQVMARQQ